MCAKLYLISSSLSGPIYLRIIFSFKKLFIYFGVPLKKSTSEEKIIVIFGFIRVFHALV